MLATATNGVKEIMNLVGTPTIKELAHGEPVERLAEMLIYLTYSIKTTKIGEHLSEEMKESITKFLNEHLDVFARIYADMSGINLNLMVHKLNVNLNFKPI